MHPNEQAKVSILIADKSPIVRYGLGHWIRSRGTFEVVGLARNFQEIKRLLATRAPELLVMDLDLLEDNAAQKWKEAQAEVAGVKLVSFGTDAEHEVERAVDCEAAAHVLKNEELAKLDGVLTSVHMGNTYLRRKTTAPPIAVSSPGDNSTKLSARETEILQLIAHGKTSAEVSTLLGIRPRTVNAHRTNISNKLNLRRLADLVTYAMRTGIVQQ